MTNDTRVDQPGFLRAQRLGIEIVPPQESWELIGEEYVGILQQTCERGTIFLGVIQYRRAHTHLDVPGESLQLRVVWPPDVQDIRAVQGEVSADRASGNDVPHAERANAFQRNLSTRLERNGFALTDLLDGDERHVGENLRVLKLPAKFFERAHRGHDNAGFRRRRLQLLRTPLQNGVLNGLDDLAAPEQF